LIFFQRFHSHRFIFHIFHYGSCGFSIFATDFYFGNFPKIFPNKKAHHRSDALLRVLGGSNPLSAGDAVGAVLVTGGVPDSVGHIVPSDPEPAHEGDADSTCPGMPRFRKGAPIHVSSQ
jgi:hypothetical protein